MRSVAFDFQRGSLIERRLADPADPAPREILFRILSVGVCGTDRDIAAGLLGEPPAGSGELVIGHEALGEVVACGADARRFVPGDWVVPMPRRSCPERCASCRGGRRDLCLTLRYSERGIFREHGYFTEYAIDHEDDLIAAPRALGGDAVLLEPMSVVEKAVARAVATEQAGGRRALVLGLGPIGILTAAALAVRGFEVTVHSAEDAAHPRVGLLRPLEIRYSERLPGEPFDTIVEAAGSGELALAALRTLAPCGSMVIVGARDVAGTFPFLGLLVKNQTVSGIVNASREHFDSAGEDLLRVPAQLRAGLIQRFGFEEFRNTLAAAPVAAAKAIHMIAG
jgi:threonine dehydrogenase-like Zn-dependent dehydrogenase